MKNKRPPSLYRQVNAGYAAFLARRRKTGSVIHRTLREQISASAIAAVQEKRRTA